MTANLLEPEELPHGFQYPTQFLRVVELGLTRLEPWWIVEGELLRERHRGLAAGAPPNRLVLFAVRQDNDDVACFDAAAGGVVILHDFSEWGWSHRRILTSFDDWLRTVLEDFLQFGEL